MRQEILVEVVKEEGYREQSLIQNMMTNENKAGKAVRMLLLAFQASNEGSCCQNREVR